MSDQPMVGFPQRSSGAVLALVYSLRIACNMTSARLPSRSTDEAKRARWMLMIVQSRIQKAPWCLARKRNGVIAAETHRKRYRKMIGRAPARARANPKIFRTLKTRKTSMLLQRRPSTLTDHSDASKVKRSRIHRTA